MRFNVRVASTAVVGIGAMVAVAAVNSGGLWPAEMARAQMDNGFARAVLHTAAGAEVGRATFSDEDGQLMVSVDASGLDARFHGMHVHSAGRCDGPDFTSAGSHFNTGMAMQGMTGHDGDLPSLLVNQDGTATLRVTTDRSALTIYWLAREPR